jgi:beta-lactamase class A
LTAFADLTESPRLTAALLGALEDASLRDIASAYVVDIGSSDFAHWRADEDVYPASVIKIALMTEAFRRYAVADIAPDDRIVIESRNLTPTAEATPLVTGYEARVDELVDLMIARSDNIATNQLIDLLRRERVTAAMRALGLEGFLLGRKLSGADPLIDDPEMTGRNSLSAANAARLLYLIATDVVPGAAEQRDILAHCMHDDKLAPGLRDGDRFMHKTGETTTVSHDAGIVVTADGDPYVVVLYTTPEPAPGGGDASHANPRMVRWMSALRPALVR